MWVWLNSTSQNNRALPLWRRVLAPTVPVLARRGQPSSEMGCGVGFAGRTRAHRRADRRYASAADRVENPRGGRDHPQGAHLGQLAGAAGREAGARGCASIAGRDRRVGEVGEVGPRGTRAAANRRGGSRVGEVGVTGTGATAEGRRDNRGGQFGSRGTSATVELVKLDSQERVQQRTAEETVELVKLVSQERVQQRTAEVPVEVVNLVSQERVQQRIAEAQLTGNIPQERISERTQIVDAPVPQILEKLVSQERVQQRTAETVAVVGLAPRQRVQQRQGLETNMSFRNGCPKGFLNRAGLSKYSRLQAKTGACSVQWSSISMSLSR